MIWILAILLIIILVVLVRCIVIVPQSNAYVTEWLGVYKDTWGAGLHIRTPFVERMQGRWCTLALPDVSLRGRFAPVAISGRHFRPILVNVKWYAPIASVAALSERHRQSQVLQ